MYTYNLFVGKYSFEGFTLRRFFWYLGSQASVAVIYDEDFLLTKVVKLLDSLEFVKVNHQIHQNIYKYMYL